MTMKNLSFFNKIIFLFNLLAEFALFLSYLASFVSPEKFWILAFFGLAFPFILAANILFVIYWAVQLKWQFMISLVAIAIGYKFLLSFYAYNPKAIDSSGKNAIKVLSYNVRLFDLYNWSENKETRDKIVALLKEEKPQILCIQEFFHDNTGYFPTINHIKEIEGIKKHFLHNYVSMKDTAWWGIAIFSAFPIIDKGVIEFEKSHGNLCIYADMKINKDTVRVYNLHLQSVKFKPEDYKILDQIENYKNENNILLISGKRIVWRLKEAFQKRAPQVDIISKHIRKCPYKVLVCGDFNDTPTSYTYHNLSKGLSDAFIESGNGFGNTYIGKAPSFRIDYILHSPEILSSAFRVLPEKLSDHHAVSCFIELNED